MQIPASSQFIVFYDYSKRVVAGPPLLPGCTEVLTIVLY
jgi:hypothetical protein